MSEYQFYEFKSIDKALTSKKKEVISSWSSRTKVTNSGATFVYHYSDFPQDELKVVEKYFDAMLYIANWGTRRLIFKISNDFIDKKKIKQYCVEGLEVYEHKDFILIDICLQDEDGMCSWIEDDGMLASLITLRDDIISGDYRSLYLIWLKVSTEDVMNNYGDVEAESKEPEVPSGLKELSGSLFEFVEFFDIDKDTISASAIISETLNSVKDVDYLSGIANLSDKEKNDWLLRLIRNEPLLSEKIKRSLGVLKVKCGHTANRTVADLAKGSLRIKEERKNLEKKKQEEERLAKLKKIEIKKDELWEDVYSLIKQKKTKSYDEAIEILSSLKDLAIYKQDFETFKKKIEQIKQQNSKLSGLKWRIDSVKLLEI